MSTDKIKEYLNKNVNCLYATTGPRIITTGDRIELIQKYYEEYDRIRDGVNFSFSDKALNSSDVFLHYLFLNQNIKSEDDVGYVPYVNERLIYNKDFLLDEDIIEYCDKHKHNPIIVLSVLKSIPVSENTFNEIIKKAPQVLSLINLEFKELEADVLKEKDSKVYNPTPRFIPLIIDNAKYLLSDKNLEKLDYMPLAVLPIDNPEKFLEKYENNSVALSKLICNPRNPFTEEFKEKVFENETIIEGLYNLPSGITKDIVLSLCDEIDVLIKKEKNNELEKSAYENITKTLFKIQKTIDRNCIVDGEMVETIYCTIKNLYNDYRETPHSTYTLNGFEAVISALTWNVETLDCDLARDMSDFALDIDAPLVYRRIAPFLTEDDLRETFRRLVDIVCERVDELKASPFDEVRDAPCAIVLSDMLSSPDFRDVMLLPAFEFQDLSNIDDRTLEKIMLSSNRTTAHHFGFDLKDKPEGLIFSLSFKNIIDSIIAAMPPERSDVLYNCYDKFARYFVSAFYDPYYGKKITTKRNSKFWNTAKDNIMFENPNKLMFYPTKEEYSLLKTMFSAIDISTENANLCGKCVVDTDKERFCKTFNLARNNFLEDLETNFKIRQLSEKSPHIDIINPTLPPFTSSCDKIISCENNLIAPALSYDLDTSGKPLLIFKPYIKKDRLPLNHIRSTTEKENIDEFLRLCCNIPYELKHLLNSMFLKDMVAEPEKSILFEETKSKISRLDNVIEINDIIENIIGKNVKKEVKNKDIENIGNVER